MVKCEYCRKEMRIADSCTFNRIIIDGESYKRNRSDYDLNERCHDCGIVNREENIHHYGCDMESCPSCNEQLIGCGCSIASIIDDKKHLVINFSERNPEEYIVLLKEKGLI
jgi:hypothetical protein